MSASIENPSRLRDADVLLSILDNLPTSIFVKDEDLKFVFSNKIHCDMIGKSEEELLGKSDGDFYEGESASGFMERDRSVILSGAVSEAEERASRKDGMTKPVLTRKARLHGPNGKTYLIGTNSDLTEVKKREQQHKALAETVPVGVMQIEENGDVAFVNSLCLGYLGLTKKPEDCEELKETFPALSRDFPGMTQSFEMDVAGLRRVLVISSGWLKLPDKRGRSAMISIVDISEMIQLRKVNDEISRLNLELAENMKRLNEAQDELVKRGRMEQLGQLTATVAHELRNPLGAVSTSCYILERKLADKKLGVDVQLSRISNGIKRCDNIITQLLDFSRSKKLACKPGDLDSWLTETVGELKRELPKMVSVQLDLGLNGDQVPFDPQRLRRAVVNLVANASEAMVGDGQDPSKIVTKDAKITITTVRSGSNVWLKVADNGPGMPTEVLAKIREPLFTTKSFGTGLGVPAVEQIVTQHGGSLLIESEVGTGSIFTMELPFIAAAEAA